MRSARLFGGDSVSIWFLSWPILARTIPNAPFITVDGSNYTRRIGKVKFKSKETIYAAE